MWNQKPEVTPELMEFKNNFSDEIRKLDENW